MRIFFLFLGLGGLTAVVATLTQRSPEALQDGDTLAQLAFLSVLLCALLFGGGSERRAPLREIVVNLSVWAAMILGLVLAYDNRVELKQTALRTLSALTPGEPVMLSAREAVLTRERSGHFTAYATVNGERIHMLVDTGSTDVALPFTDARHLGVDVDALVFDRPVMTANGRAMVAAITLEEVAVGGIRMSNVDASIAEKGKLSGALLGMSFLGRLSEFSFQGDKLILKE